MKIVNLICLHVRPRKIVGLEIENAADGSDRASAVISTMLPTISLLCPMARTSSVRIANRKSQILK